MEKKIIVLFIIFLLTSMTLVVNTVRGEGLPEINNSEKLDNAYRFNNRAWIYLHIEGKAYDRGFQHGYLLAPEIVDVIIRWSNVIHNGPEYNSEIYDFESEEYKQISITWWDYVRENIEKDYWDRTPEEYQQEIQGIADGVKAKGGMVFNRDVDYVDILSINHMFEFMVKLENPRKGFHPLRSLFYSIKDLLNSGNDKQVTEAGFIKSFLDQPPTDHCNAFIATGDATTNGQIVAAHNIRCGGWWYEYYIAQRWNLVCDIIPSDGQRLMMASSPGFIWSDENFYQNEQGIIIMDTTLFQGLWQNKGYSMVIRTRMAAQYSESVDDALDFLMSKNDGLWTAAYLIGDTKTGEIARLDLALYHHQIWRKSDGYLISANNGRNLGVRFEANGLGLRGEIYKLIGIGGYGYSTLRYFDTPRDTKLIEMGEKYYGDIDIEVLKHKIMFEYPVCDSSTTDCKAMDSYLIEDNSCWVFHGRTNGEIWEVEPFDKNLKGAVAVPSNGWTQICGLPEDHNVELEPETDYSSIKKSKTIWKYDIADDLVGRNMMYAQLAKSEDFLIAADTYGYVTALNPLSGKEIWKQKTNLFGAMTYVNTDSDTVVVGWENQTNAYYLSTGEEKWVNYQASHITSQPVFIDEKILVGSRNGDLYALEKNTGDIIWQKTFPNQRVYISKEQKGDNVFITAGKQCYKINTIDGDTIWNYTSDGKIAASPHYCKNLVYFGSCDTNLYALNADNGKLKWKYPTAWAITTTPKHSNKIVYTSSNDHRMYAINKNGEKIWSYKCNASIHMSPTVYGDYVFFGCDDGWYYALDKNDGQLIWRFAPRNTIGNDIYNYVTTAIVGNTVESNGIIYTSANGEIFAFSGQTKEYIKTGEETKNKGFLDANSVLIIIFIMIIVILALIFVTPKE